MSTNTHIKGRDAGVNSPLPFDGLLAILKKEGFVIKPDDYIELLSVSRLFIDNDVNRLKYRLAPLVATGELEQQRFYAVFDQYARDVQLNDETAADQQSKKKRKRFAIFATAALLLVAGVIAGRAIISKRPSVAGAYFDVRVNGVAADIALIGDTIVADATPYLRQRKIDSADAEVNWELGEGEQRAVGITTTVRPQKTGPMHIKMRLQRRNTQNMDSVVARTITICASIIEALKAEKTEGLKPRDNLIVLPVIRGDPDIAANAVWIINGTDTIRNMPSRLQYQIDSAGTYLVDYMPAQANTCNTFSPLNIFVEKTTQAARLDVEEVGNLITPSEGYRLWTYALLLLPVFGAVITSLVQRRLRKKMLEPVSATQQPESRSLLPPMDVPLVNRELDVVNREPMLNQLYIGMRKRVEDDVQVLDINKSIRAEIMAGGIPSLMFTQRLKPQEYLVLIDRSKNSGQQWKLFEYLLNVFNEENIHVERFFYTAFNRFYNNAFPEGISLQRLSDLYKTNVLLIFGNGQQLLHPHLAAVDVDIKDRLLDWELRAVVTPVPYADWSSREEALKKAAVVLPADIRGLVMLVQAIHEKQFDLKASLQALPSLYDTGSWMLDSIDDIEAYIDDPILFQWLCSIAVYPKLRWEMIIEVGRAICDAAGKPEVVNYTSLLKLVRIPWMQEGAIPDHTRVALMKRLSVANEVIARETILRLLNEPNVYAEQDHFFQQEKTQQQLANKFVLFAHDRGRYSDYESAFHEFTKRWNDKKIHDAPFVRYIDKKPGDDWVTPLDQTAGKPLKTVMNEARDELLKLKNAPFRVAYYAFGILFLLVISMLLFGKPLIRSLFPRDNLFLLVDSTQNHRLQFTLQLDSCSADLDLEARGMQGLLMINQHNYPLQFTTENVATVVAPYRDIAANRGVVQLSWNNNSNLVNQEISLTDRSDLLLKTCIPPEGSRPQLQITYNDPSKLDSLFFLARRFDTGFAVNFELVKSDRPSYIFLSTALAPDVRTNLAAEMQRVVKQFYNQDLIIVDSAGGQVSTMFINFSAEPDWVAMSVPALPASIKEIWGGTASNRLMTIDPTSRLLWYSTGDPQTYGTYRIEQASKKGNSFRLILSGDKQYRVVFMQNIRAGSFQACMVEASFSSVAQAAELDLSACKRMERMTEYYAATRGPIANQPANIAQSYDNTQYYYYPLAPNASLRNVETERLMKSQASYGTEYRAVVTYHRNTFFSGIKGLTAPVNTRMNQLRKMLKAEVTMTGDGRETTFRGTPFDRDYISVSWEEQTIDYKQNAPGKAPPIPKKY